MRRPIVRGLSVGILLWGLFGGETPAQNLAPEAAGPVGSNSLPLPRRSTARRIRTSAVQEAPPPPPVVPETTPPTPAPTPPTPDVGAPAPTPPATSTAPEASNADLSTPKSEREGGGGEPTAATAAAEEKKEETPAEPEKPDETPLLAKFLGREESDLKIYGWIQNSYTGNTNGTPKSRMNFGVTPNDLANSWMGNQYYLIFERALKQNDRINFGYRIDNLFGHDWQFNHSHGIFDTAFEVNHFAGYDPAQFYAEVHLPFLTKGGLDIKGGRFYTILGYEVVPATGRPLLSVPYMFNYGQPFTHIGFLSTFHLTDRVNLYNGAVNGSDHGFDTQYKYNYIGGFTYTSKDSKLNLAVSTIAGPQQYPRFLPTNTHIQPTGILVTPPIFSGRKNPGYGGNDRTTVTTVLSYKWNDKLTQIVESDQSFESNVPFSGVNGTPHNSEWYSLGNWFLYQASPKLTGVWRSEVFRDNNGTRTGFADNFYEITLGMIYKPWYWMWIRPEARYDWAQFTHPYNDNTRRSQLTLAFDIILLF